MKWNGKKKKHQLNKCSLKCNLRLECTKIEIKIRAHAHHNKIKVIMISEMIGGFNEIEHTKPFQLNLEIGFSFSWCARLGDSMLNDRLWRSNGSKTKIKIKTKDMNRNMNRKRWRRRRRSKQVCVQQNNAITRQSIPMNHFREFSLSHHNFWVKAKKIAAHNAMRAIFSRSHEIKTWNLYGSCLKFFFFFFRWSTIWFNLRWKRAETLESSI